MSTLTLNTLFLIASAQFNIPDGLLKSLCWVESKHNITAVHVDDGNGNSIGVCQVKYITSKWMGFSGSEKELMNPKENIFYAASYLSYQMRRYKGSINKAVIAYNMGHAGSLTSTDYQTKVFKQWKRYVYENLTCRPKEGN